MDREELRTRLEEFDELWEALFPGERARMLGLLLEEVEYEAFIGRIIMKFRRS